MLFGSSLTQSALGHSNSCQCLLCVVLRFTPHGKTVVIESFLGLIIIHQVATGLVLVLLIDGPPEAMLAAIAISLLHVAVCEQGAHSVGNGLHAVVLSCGIHH